MLVFFKCPIFPIFRIRKNGAFKKNEHKKDGHFEKKHVINFKTEKESKMKFFDFWAFQNRYAKYANILTVYAGATVTHLNREAICRLYFSAGHIQLF